jgi:hypothetical protein
VVKPIAGQFLVSCRWRGFPAIDEFAVSSPKINFSVDLSQRRRGIAGISASAPLHAVRGMLRPLAPKVFFVTAFERNKLVAISYS